MKGPERTAIRAATASIAISAILATIKIVVGMRANSVAVVSDGFESASDCFTSGLVLFGLWVASKPADEDHPYGHGRFEILMGLAIGLILAAAGAGISLNSLYNRNDHHLTQLRAIWPLVASIVVKLILGAVKRVIARRSGSVSLSADSWHDFVDVLSGFVALLAVLLAVYFPSTMAPADHWGGFLVGMIVIYLGVRVTRETVLQLMDTMPEGPRMEEIRVAALQVPGALAIEKCYARKTGMRYHVDLHLEVDPNLSVWQSHEIAHAVKQTVTTDLPWVEDVLVHVEPHPARAHSNATITQ
jgi:cation diffusion facilitator family transporter